MYFMNEMEILNWYSRLPQHTIRGKAARILYFHVQEVNQHSDGWAYWAAPVRAASKLMQLVEGTGTPTEDTLRKALTPLKSFYTRVGHKAGMTFKQYEPEQTPEVSEYQDPYSDEAYERENNV